MTRDRIAYDATWAGRDFTLVDTGGWEPDSRGLQARISAQAERAVADGRRRPVRRRRPRRRDRDRSERWLARCGGRSGR